MKKSAMVLTCLLLCVTFCCVPFLSVFAAVTYIDINDVPYYYFKDKSGANVTFSVSRPTNTFTFNTTRTVDTDTLYFDLFRNNVSDTYSISSTSGYRYNYHLMRTGYLSYTFTFSSPSADIVNEDISFPTANHYNAFSAKYGTSSSSYGYTPFVYKSFNVSRYDDTATTGPYKYILTAVIFIDTTSIDQYLYNSAYVQTYLYKFTLLNGHMFSGTQTGTFMVQSVPDFEVLSSVQRIDFALNGITGDGQSVVDNLDSGSQTVNDTVDDYNSVQGDITDDFNTNFDSLDIGSFAFDSDFMASANWFRQIMTLFYNQLAGFTTFIIYPLILALVMFFLGRGSRIFNSGRNK